MLEDNEHYGLLGANERGYRLLTSLVRPLVNALAPKPSEGERLRAQPNLTALPVAWGTPEFRLRVLYAGEVSARSVRISEYVGANFFAVVYVYHDTDQLLKRHYPIYANESILSEVLKTFFISGETPRLDREGESLYLDWLDGAPLVHPFIPQPKKVLQPH